MIQVKMKEIKSNNNQKYHQVLIMKILKLIIQSKDQFVQRLTWLFYQVEELNQLTTTLVKIRFTMICLKTKR